MSQQTVTSACENIKWTRNKRERELKQDSECQEERKGRETFPVSWGAWKQNSVTS